MQNLYHLPSRGGANKSNRLMIERLARRGHECHVVAPLAGQMATIDLDQLPQYIVERGGTVLERSANGLVYEYAGVTVHGVREGRELPRTIGRVVNDAHPDWAIVPSDDPGSMLLSSALRSGVRVLYFVHTLQQLPFGPRSFYPNRAAAAMVQRANAIVSASLAAQEYVLRWSDLPSDVIYPDVYSDVSETTGPPVDREFVTLINACAYKGIDIFLPLADALPDVPFQAVASWGTTVGDREQLGARRNICTIDSVDDMDEVYGRTKVLVMPSLWDETFGYCSVEGMLRGIPVLASAVGGLREAKLGVDYLLPVKPITDYASRSPVALPQPSVPVQDVAPWLDALVRLLTDNREYSRVSAESRTAATSFVQRLDPDALEKVLLRRMTCAAVAG